MSIATVEDVETRFYRPLSVDERPLVAARLADCELKIRARIPDFDSRIIEDPYFLDVVKRVCADAVIRLVRNPEGYVQETEGNYTYMLSSAYSDGRLSITPDEWADLGVKKSVGVVHVLPLLPPSLREVDFESFR